MKNNLLKLSLLALMVFLLNQGWAQITAQEALIAMGRGINLGNTLEPEDEGGWNNGPAQEYYFDMYKEAGFTCVRIPTRWDKHVSATAPFAVDSAWMARVEEIVDWGLSRDLYVVLNMHHEEAFKADYEGQKERYDSIWSQISVRFKDKSEKLLFEMMNEPQALVTQNNIDEFNKRILGIIRKNNPTRVVIYSGSNWASSNDLLNSVIPDTTDNYLMGYYHSYDPWGFAGEGTGTWGTSADVKGMTDQMLKVQNWSAENNIPVFIGEFGAQRKCEYNSRMFYYANYAEQALAHGLAFAAWDDGGDFETMLRKDSSWNDIKDILIYSSDTSPTKLKSEVIDYSEVHLSWESRLKTKEQVFIEKRTLNTEFAVIAEFGAVSSTTDVTEYSDMDVVEGKTYYYRVVEGVNGKLIPSYPMNVFVDIKAGVKDTENSLQIYPNPVANNLEVYVAGEQIQSVSIYSTSGQLLKMQNNAANKNIVSVAFLESGVYVLVVETKNGNFKKSFIKK